jgi:Ca2+-binding RTX toxin-like protein
VIYANDGGVDRDIDCGTGTDTLYVDPATPQSQGDFRMLDTGHARNCENIVDYYRYLPALDHGVQIITGPSGGTGTGTDLRDKLLGGAGPDTFYGLGGDDLLWGDAHPGTAAPDYLDGGEGDDTLYGGGGDDVVLGGPGNDYVQGDGGNDTVYGGDGNDTLRGVSGDDDIAAGAGNDVVHAFGGGTDTIDCGPGIDTVYADRADPIANCERVRR